MEQSGWTAPRVRSGVTEVHPLEHGVIGTQNNPSSGRGKTSPRHSECADPVRTRCFPPRQAGEGEPGQAEHASSTMRQEMYDTAGQGLVATEQLTGPVSLGGEKRTDEDTGHGSGRQAPSGAAGSTRRGGRKAPSAETKCE